MAYKNQTNTNDNTTDKENILVFIIDKLNKQIQLHRPNNCYLYVVCAKDNDLDCAFCNCVLDDSTPENDECELFMLEGANSINTNTIQSNSQPQTQIIITPLATQKALLLESTNNTLKQKEAIHNNFIYSIDTSNDLCIKDKDSQTILFILSNYKCHIKQSLFNQEQHSKNNIAYILDNILYPNKSYSTFGIKLQVKQDQDTFSNKGNFEVHINNINIKQLETQTNNTIIKDTPFFCYNQHSKQITMAKLEDNSVTIRTNMNESIKEQAKKGLINPIFINLSFYPLYNNYIANNTSSQKLQLIANDINKGSVSVTFKIPNILLNNTKLIQSKKKNPQKETREILSIKFNGKKIYIIEKGEIAEEYTFQAQSGNSNNKTIMIEEGIYYIKPKEIQQSHAVNRNIKIFDISNLGNRHIKLYQNKDDTKHINTFSLFGITTTRYTIHGGKTLGDIQGIDLAHNDSKFFEALQNLTNKYNKELQEVGNVIKVEVKYGKQEIDLRGKRTPNGGIVEWISQFDNSKEGMGTKAGNTACFDTCYEILQRSNLDSASGYKTNQYIIATEKGLDLKQNSKENVNISAPILQGTQVSKIDGSFDTTKQSEYIKVVPEAKNGIAYLDYELESGYPVLVGVDHTYDKRIHNNRDRYNAPDYATDHYIVIVGRGYDTKGLFYRFYDVGTIDKNKGVSDENRLYLGSDDSLRGRSEVINSKTNKQYKFVVTQIRRNKH